MENNVYKNAKQADDTDVMFVKEQRLRSFLKSV